MQFIRKLIKQKLGGAPAPGVPPLAPGSPVPGARGGKHSELDSSGGSDREMPDLVSPAKRNGPGVQGAGVGGIKLSMGAGAAGISASVGHAQLQQSKDSDGHSNGPPAVDPDNVLVTNYMANEVKSER